MRHLEFAHRSVDIMKEKGMPMAEILTYEVVPFTTLKDAMGATVKPSKSALMVELLKYLESNQRQLPEESILSTCVIVDVMSKRRRINVKAITAFADMFRVLVSNVKRV